MCRFLKILRFTESGFQFTRNKSSYCCTKSECVPLFMVVVCAKTHTMIRSIFLLVFSLILYSCSAPKEYTYDNKMVTKRKFDRKINNFTKRFVRKMPDETKRIFLNLDVVYDTIGGVRN